MAFELSFYLERCRQIVDRYAETALPPVTRLPADLYDSMRYSFFAGGKRVRPALVFASAQAAGGYTEPAVPFATAIEMVHTYSLIHDDLPCMDDDDLRRGMPTNHVKYGDAIAILAGDALLTDAFSVMTQPEVVRSLGSEKVLRCVEIVSRAAGSMGMVAGQALDMVSQGRGLDLPTLEFLHTHKTGALIRASVHLGAVVAGADPEDEKALLRYADRLGLAFQVADDILDVEGKTEALGKPVGSDEGLAKATYPALLGMSESKRILEELIEDATLSIERFGDRAEPLLELARFVGKRDH